MIWHTHTNVKDITDINQLSVKIEDDDYLNWNKIEDHITLDELGFVLM